MRPGLLIVTVALLFSACTANPDKRVPRAAAEAMAGSPQTVVDISPMLMLEGSGAVFNLGQNPDPDADLPKFTVTRFQRVYQFGQGRWRQDVTRAPTFVTANTAPQRQITAVDGTVAFDTAADGMASRLSDQTGLDRRAELYHHPLGFLRAVFTQRGQVGNTRNEGSMAVVDMTVDGTTFTLHVDSTTNLPARITSKVNNVNLGDVVMESTFTDYMNVQGHQMPGRIVTRIDKFVTSDITFDQQSLAGNFGDLVAPSTVASMPPPPSIANVTAQEVAPGVWYLSGQSHHSVLVEFADHLTLVEAPQNDVRTLAVIKRARELRPDKPLRYLVNTHHHFDHSGGVRAAVSEGLTIITQARNKTFFEDAVARTHSLVPDALAGSRRALVLETVQDKRVLQDRMHTLELYHVAGSPHSDSMLMAYLPAERILIEADLFTPPAAGAAPAFSYPFAPNLAENILKNKLSVTRLLPIHGAVAPVSSLDTAVQREQARVGLIGAN